MPNCPPKKRNALSSPKSGLRGLAPHGLTCARTFFFLALPSEHHRGVRSCRGGAERAGAQHSSRGALGPRHALHPGIPDPPPSPLLMPYHPRSPRNNGHIFSFLRSGSLSKRTEGAHAELQVDVSSLLHRTACRGLCFIVKGCGRRQALGNEAALQDTQGSAELRTLGAAGRMFASPLDYGFEEDGGVHSASQPEGTRLRKPATWSLAVG